MIAVLNGRELSKLRPPEGPLGRVPFTNTVVTLRYIVHCGNCGAPLPGTEVGQRYLGANTHSFIFRGNPLPMSQCEACNQRSIGCARMVHIGGEDRFTEYSVAMRLDLGFETEWWIAVSQIQEEVAYKTGLKPQIAAEADLEVLIQLFEDGVLSEEEFASRCARKGQDKRLQHCLEDGVISVELFKKIQQRYSEMMDIR